jgi:aminopeptidase N
VDAPVGTGAEFSTLVFADVAAAEDDLLDVVVPHEVAHQWWYVQVGSDQHEHPWLDEALATYSEWLFARDAATRFPNTTTPTAPLNSPVSAFPDLASYQQTTYVYGAQLYRDLAREIGEETLIQGLRSYAQEHRFGTATDEDLVASLSQAAGANLAPFFEERGVVVGGQQKPDG